MLILFVFSNAGVADRFPVFGTCLRARHSQNRIHGVLSSVVGWLSAWWWAAALGQVFAEAAFKAFLQVLAALLLLGKSTRAALVEVVFLGFRV